MLPPARLGLKNVFPGIIPSHAPVGTLTKEAARALGLSEETTVFCGFKDRIALPGKAVSGPFIPLPVGDILKEGLGLGDGPFIRPDRDETEQEISVFINGDNAQGMSGNGNAPDPVFRKPALFQQGTRSKRPAVSVRLMTASGFMSWAFPASGSE